MYIASAVYDSKEFGRTKLKICTGTEADTSTHAADPDQSIITLRYNNPLAEIIMNLAAMRPLPAEFDFRGDSCKLISYAYNSEERRFNRKRMDYVVDTKVFPPYRNEVIVYTGRCRCPRCYPKYEWGTIENICGIFFLEKGGKAKVDLQWCKHCATYFIDAQSLDIYIRRLGKLKIHLQTLHDYTRRCDFWQEGAFAEDSILSRNGYLAEHSDEVRHRALECMLENGISKAEIKNKLTEFIELRGKRCHKAVYTWRADLNYVNEYHLEAERHVLFQD